MASDLPSAPSGLLTQPQLDAIVGSYLLVTNAAVVRLYEIAGTNGDGFRGPSPEAVTFTAVQLARGAMELRRLTYLAWRDSAYESVGYPPRPVQLSFDLIGCHIVGERDPAVVAALY